MIKNFLDKRSFPQVEEIIMLLNENKERLNLNDYSNSFKEFFESEIIFEELKKFAIDQNDEVFANSLFVFKNYFLLFCHLGSYFEMLKSKQYTKSWSKLQDCLDIAILVGSYTNVANRIEIPNILSLLTSYEALYPYTYFASSEYVISKSECSICGKSMLNLCCPHIKGDLYWGEMACEKIIEIKEVHAVALVKNPADKRCIMESSNDDLSEIEKFKRLDMFLDLNLNFLVEFSINTTIENKKRNDLKIVRRNEICPCGSDLKFKNCCGKELYYKHEKNIITKLQTVNLVKL